MPVHHGPIPSLAWRVDAGGCSLVLSGDTSNRGDSLQRFAAGADLLLAHNAVPQGAGGAAVALHMRPLEIGRIAAAAKVGLEARCKRSCGF